MTQIKADVVIVGSGVAGALAACELSKQGVEVAVLEAGPWIDRATALERYRKATIRVPESPYHTPENADFPQSHDLAGWYRQSGVDNFKSTYLKAVGGTTWHWLGTVLRYLPSDFRLRTEYGKGVDWPFGYDELEPFYSQADRELGVAGDSSHDLGSPRSSPYPMPAIPLTYMDSVFQRALAGSNIEIQSTPQARNSQVFDERPACCGSASCIPICPVGAKYDATVHVRRAKKLGAAIYPNHVAVRVSLNESSRVDGIHYRRMDGSEGIVLGKLYIVAAHGVETPRLLLNSATEKYPNGVANSSGQVGCNLMDHPIQLSWALSKEPVWPYRGPLSTSGIETFRDGAFRSDRSSFRTQVSNDGWSWPTGGILTLPGNLAEKGLRGARLRAAVADHTKRQIQLASLTEQLPEAGNRIVLDKRDRDRYGVPLPRIHYRVGTYARDGMLAARALHDQVFRLMDATEIHHRDEFEGAGHIIGTARMGDNPKDSVVDSNLRSYDHSNLFILGSSVFPTSGTANPTLTIAALVLRSIDPMQRALQAAG